MLINAGGVPSTHNITTLAPNAVTTVSVPITRPPTSGSATLDIDSRVSLSGGIVDAKPSNDQRSESYAPVAP